MVIRTIGNFCLLFTLAIKMLPTNPCSNYSGKKLFWNENSITTVVTKEARYKRIYPNYQANILTHSKNNL